MGGGGGTSSREKVKRSPEATQLAELTAQQASQLLGAHPLTEFAGAQPLQIAPMSGDQLATIQRLVALQNEPLLRSNELQALQVAREQMGLEGPRTALEGHFKNFTLPLIQSELNKAGLVTSGAYGDALAKAGGELAVAMAPYQANASNAYIQALLGAGGAEEARATGRPRAAFNAEEAIRQIVQQGNEATFNDFLRRQNLSENALAPGTAILTQPTGSTTDTRGGGLWGSLFGGGAKSLIPLIFSLSGLMAALSNVLV